MANRARPNPDAPIAWSPIAWSRTAGHHTAAAGRERIIHSASIMGTVARPTIPASATSNAGLVGTTKALGVELAPNGITVNAIWPGYVATEMNTALVQDPDIHAMVVDSTPVARSGTPDEVVAAAVFLASPEASYVDGQTLLVDDGMTTAL